MPEGNASMQPWHHPGRRPGRLTPDTIAKVWSEFMCRFTLPLFLTYTYAPTRGTGRVVFNPHPEKVAKDAMRWLHLGSELLHGPNYRRRTQGLQGIAGIEPHKSGRLHAHLVVGHPDLDLAAAEFGQVRQDIRQIAQDLYGWSKVEVARSAEGVTAYCSKYLVKGGELVLSPGLGALHRGRLAGLPFKAPA
jgi:hypothetical protein